MSIDYSVLALPKGKTRRQVRARLKRERRDRVAEIRAYVFGRERGICRCCRSRRADSMHELRPKSLGGKVSKRNSVAVCGDGVQGCHGYLQRHEIDAEYGDHGADARLVFRPRTPLSMIWLKLHEHAVIESEPMGVYGA